MSKIKKLTQSTGNTVKFRLLCGLNRIKQKVLEKVLDESARKSAR